MIEIVREEITTPDAWVGPKIQNDDSWIVRLDDADIAEIDAALAHAKAAGTRVPFDDAALFPLPAFKAKIATIVDLLTAGPGVVLVRGLPRERYSDSECEMIYWAIGVHMGNPVSQNARGHRLGHVTDEGKTLDDPNARGYQTKNRLDFHCDQLPVDVLGLLCLRTAKSGGASFVVSATTVHNVMLRERPDLLEALYQVYHVDWRGDHPDGGQPWYDVPMFSARDGLVTSRFTNRSFLESVTRYGEQLGMSDLQREAVNYAQGVAERPELRLQVEFREGDMQFVNNHTTLHARAAYEDYDEPARKRHLLRMWTALPDAKRRPLSPLLADRYRYVEEGGIPRQAAAA